MSTPRIMIVDDDDCIIRSIRRTLRKEGLDVTYINSPLKALRELEANEYAVLLTDHLMPVMNGLKFLENASQISPHTVRLMLTGCTESSIPIEAINRIGIYRFLTKPWNEAELRQVLHQAVHAHSLETQNRELQSLTSQQNEELCSLNKRLVKMRENETAIGARIQSNLLRGPLTLNNTYCSISAHNVPSKTIDGDFFDLYEHDEQCIDIVIGDVMGKGTPAALLGAATKSQVLRALSILHSRCNNGELPQPADIINAAHQNATEELIQLGSFVTLCYARFDFRNRTVTVVDCGHTPTLLYHRNRGEFSAVKNDNMPLGFSATEIYQQHTLSFEDGDVFCFYSDGLTERRNNSGEFFGEDRMRQLVAESADQGANTAMQSIFAATTAFAANPNADDDCTCIIVNTRRTDQSRAEFALRGNLDELADLRKELRHFVDRSWDGTLNEENFHLTALALQEVLTNVIRHGQLDHHPTHISIEAQRDKDDLILHAHHWGKAFTPPAEIHPQLNGEQDHGYGLYIIEQALDDITYHSNDNNTQTIRLVKNLN